MAYKQIIIALIVIVLSVFSGWKLNTYYTGYQLSQTQEVQKIVDDGMRNIQQNQAKVLQDKLDELKNQPFKIQKEKETILNQPIYSTQCIDQKGIELLKKNQEQLNETRNKGR